MRIKSWTRFESWHGKHCQIPSWRRFYSSEDSALHHGSGARTGKLANVEAALFAADGPLNLQKLASVARLSSVEEAKTLVRKLEQIYEEEGSGFEIIELAGGVQLATRPALQDWLIRLFPPQEPELSHAARESLTIIAYRQPITRADIEAIRGVSTGDLLRQLMEKGLIRIAGRDTSLGRPVLYATTKLFLQLHGLRSLAELPRLEGDDQK